MKKWSKIMAWLLLTPLFVSLFTAVLLYIPPIQRWAIDQATSYASEKLGMDIRMSRVSISFPLDLELHGLEIEQDGETIFINSYEKLHQLITGEEF